MSSRRKGLPRNVSGRYGHAWIEHGFEDVTAGRVAAEDLLAPAPHDHASSASSRKKRQREKVMRIFHNIRSAWRIIGASCAEQHEEWGTGGYYFEIDGFYAWHASFEDTEPVTRSA